MPVPERPVLVAPDSFKGTFRAAQVAGAIGRGLERAGLMPPDLCPVADGGEGTLDALLPQLGGELEGAKVHDPLGREITAQFGLVEDGGTAIVEMAAASGLGLVAEDERDAWAASTYGTGELIVAAARAGAAVILVAVGGSATMDGGAGALEAIEEARRPRRREARRAVRRAHAVGGRAARVRAAEGRRRRDDRAPRAAPRRARAAAPEGPARRADDRRRGRRSPVACGPRTAPRSSRARRSCSTRSTSTTRMRASRAVVTGEGKLDQQTLQGKLVGEIGTRARQAGVPLHAIVGRDELDPFGKRIIDLQFVREATTLEELEDAAEELGAALATGAA